MHKHRKVDTHAQNVLISQAADGQIDLRNKRHPFIEGREKRDGKKVGEENNSRGINTASLLLKAAEWISLSECIQLKEMDPDDVVPLLRNEDHCTWTTVSYPSYGANVSLDFMLYLLPSTNVQESKFNCVPKLRSVNSDLQICITKRWLTNTGFKHQRLTSRLHTNKANIKATFGSDAEGKVDGIFHHHKP